MSDKIPASHCEAKKHALRQTQDGIVVSFVLHPNEVPAHLQLAALGTRFMLAFAEIGDDEKPVEPKEEPAQGAIIPARTASVLAQRVGRLCNDPRFQAFLRERRPERWKLFDANNIADSERAAHVVRWYCGVESRSEIKPGTAAEQRWNLLESGYLAEGAFA